MDALSLLRKLSLSLRKDTITGPSSEVISKLLLVESILERDVHHT